jgi:hypothetical protein
LMVVNDLDVNFLLVVHELFFKSLHVFGFLSNLVLLLLLRQLIVLQEISHKVLYRVRHNKLVNLRNKELKSRLNACAPELLVNNVEMQLK